MLRSVLTLPVSAPVSASGQKQKFSGALMSNTVSVAWERWLHFEIEQCWFMVE